MRSLLCTVFLLLLSLTSIGQNEDDLKIAVSQKNVCSLYLGDSLVETIKFSPTTKATLESLIDPLDHSGKLKITVHPKAHFEVVFQILEIAQRKALDPIFSLKK